MTLLCEYTGHCPHTPHPVGTQPQPSTRFNTPLSHPPLTSSVLQGLTQMNSNHSTGVICGKKGCIPMQSLLTHNSKHSKVRRHAQQGTGSHASLQRQPCTHRHMHTTDILVSHHNPSSRAEQAVGVTLHKHTARLHQATNTHRTRTQLHNRWMTRKHCNMHSTQGGNKLPGGTKIKVL